MPLPALHERWIREALGAAPPEESRATCAECAMLEDGAAPGRPAASSFHPQTKCCTYQPALPSFLVGALLSDPGPELEHGRVAALARIRARVGLSPLWLRATPTYATLYRAMKSSGRFGREVTLRCPFYRPADGGCGIWPYRSSSCSTWYCRHGRGAVSHRLWTALRHLLRTAEVAVAVHCACRASPHLAALPGVQALVERGSPAAPADPVDSDAARQAHDRLCAEWHGREEELFRQCWEVAESLPWPEVARLGGDRLATCVREAAAALAALHDRTLPEALRLGPHSVRRAGAAAVRVVAYSPYDPLTLPRRLLAALHHFDGRPTAEALAAIAESGGVAIPPELLRALVDFRLLVEAGDGAAAPRAG